MINNKQINIICQSCFNRGFVAKGSFDKEPCNKCEVGHQMKKNLQELERSRKVFRYPARN